METVTIDPARMLTEAEADALAGTLLEDDSYDRLIAHDARVLKPDGTPLLVYRSGVLPAALCRRAYQALRTAASVTDNRGMAGGLLGPSRQTDRPIGVAGRTRYRPRKADGSLSNQNAALPVRSGIVGYFDRSTRFPYCRQTAFTIEHTDLFLQAHPFIQAVDRIFAIELPDRHAAQKAVARRTHPDFVIHGTVFTTVTVNRNWQTAVHKDVGDLKAGFGVMACLRAGRYTGGHLVFPRYRVAVDMRTGGVLLADVHEWHGNTPLVGQPGGFERISLVFYYRERMHECGSAAAERDRAKRRQRGQPLHEGRLKVIPGRAEPTP